MAPRARIVIARSRLKQPAYQLKRASSHKLLQWLLCSISTTPTQNREFNHSASGVPKLTSRMDGHLNISLARSTNWLAAGVSCEAMIGIDIEVIKPRKNIPEKVEYLEWKVPVHNVQDFHARWTLWEASAKCVDGSALMSGNTGFEKLSTADTRSRVGKSGQWHGLHDCMDEEVFYAMVLRCQKDVKLAYRILDNEKLRPW